jgi:hypothetical protein
MNQLILIGIILDIIGVGIIIIDDLTSSGVHIRQMYPKLKQHKGNVFQKFAYYLALKFSTDKSVDLECYFAKSFVKRLYGFLLIFIGFIIQEIAIIIGLVSKVK